MYEVTALAPEGPEEVYQAMVFAAVSYTHLDVYKRQTMH